MSIKKMEARAKQLFGCDSARILQYDTMFLVIGWNRRSEGEWVQVHGEKAKPHNFDYLEEKTVARGKTLTALWRSALKHHRLETLFKNPKEGRFKAWREFLKQRRWPQPKGLREACRKVDRAGRKVLA